MPVNIPSQGISVKKIVSAATTNATVIKAVEGQVMGWSCSNVNAAVRYMKLYDQAASPTVGTDVPKMTIAIPGGSTAGAIHSQSIPGGVFFASGICLALTTEATDAGTTAVAANEIVINLIYG